MARTEARKRAQQRYSQKTKTVSFRVPNELYDELEAIKAKANVSYADFVKLGAGVCKREMQAKLKRIGGLENRIATLEDREQQLKLELEQFLSEKRKRRLKELDIELGSYKLFDRGWKPEEVSEKLGIERRTATHYFEEWQRERLDRAARENLQLERCLQEHINRLRRDIAWYQVWPESFRGTKPEQLQSELNYATQFVGKLSRMPKAYRSLLLNRYSASES
jgi:Arc/MetJ-type ribon-helix-helix transcriptional regulator